MGQITIYPDDDSERRVRMAARSAGMPVSRWIAEAIGSYALTTWPQSIRELPGIWDDVERPPQTGKDIEREAL